MNRFTSAEAPPPAGWYWVISRRFPPQIGKVHHTYDGDYAWVSVGDQDLFEWGEGEEFVLVGPLVAPADEFNEGESK